MWALYGSYYPRRGRQKLVIIVSDQNNPCSVTAGEGKVIAHIGDIGADEPTSRNVVASVCQYVVDTMSVADLMPYTFVIDKWVQADRAEAFIGIIKDNDIQGYFHHPVFNESDTEYSVYVDGVYKFPDLIYSEKFSKKILDPSFRKCMFFISSAIRYPDHTSSFCIHAVESIRAAYGDGKNTKDRRRAWSVMHEDLETERYSRIVSSEEFQSERHGQVIPRSWSERAAVLAPTIEIAYRYACKLLI